jgi:putative transposase
VTHRSCIARQAIEQQSAERGILKQAGGGTPVSELCREHVMSRASFYNWRAKFGGMDASLISEMKDMSEQNRRLKRMYGEMTMSATIF